MAITNATFARRTEGAAPHSTPDRRRHKRVEVTLFGRFMCENKQEFPCRLKDISVGGAALLTPVGVVLGERIIAYIDQIGGLEGTVARSFDGGFAIQFTATPRKREKLAAQLTWLINREELDPAEERRHERSVPKNNWSTLKLADGIVTQCNVLDISVSGASISTDARPPIGNEVLLGKLRAKVVRHHDRGIGVQFIDTQEPGTLDDQFS